MAGKHLHYYHQHLDWSWFRQFCQMWHWGKRMRQMFHGSSTTLNQTVQGSLRSAFFLLLTWCFHRAHWTPHHWTQTDPQSWQSSVGSGSRRRPGRIRWDHEGLWRIARDRNLVPLTSSIKVICSYLLQRQVVGEGALHVVILAGRVHVVGAYLQDTVQKFGALFNSTLKHTSNCVLSCFGRPSLQTGRKSEFCNCDCQGQRHPWPHSSTTLLTFICGLHFEKCSVRNRKGDVIFREAGAPSDAEGYLTSSTVFLLFVSLRVSSTKLSQRPLQSSGSSVKAAGIVFRALMLKLYNVWP